MKVTFMKQVLHVIQNQCKAYCIYIKEMVV